MNIKDFKVGDRVFIVDSGWRSVMSIKAELLKCQTVEATVTAVTRKYVTVDWRNAKFGNCKYLDGHPMFLTKHEFNSNDMLFKSREDFERYIKILDMCQEIRSFCSCSLDSRVAPDKIEALYAIIKECEQNG